MTTALRTLAVALAGLAGAAPGATAAEPPPEPQGAQAAIVVDARDGDVMLARDPDERRPIASTTKLMTALLALEEAEPDEVFTAPPYDALPAESRIDLRGGERMTVHDLLRALLLESANDAAAALAVGISGSREAFVGRMNERAASLGLDDTSYANPIGLDDPGNYSTARDLATLTRYLMNNRRFANIVDMPSAVLESGDRQRVVENRNRLVVEEDWVDGVKTGHTLQAGYLLVGAADGPGGAGVISVVMGEPSEAARDSESLGLLRWGLEQFRRVRVLGPRRPVATAAVEHRDERADLVPRRPVTVTVRDGQRVGRRVLAPDEVEGPLPAGARVGRATVVVDGEAVRRVPLVTAEAVPGAGPLRVVLSVLGVPLTLVLVIAILVLAGVALLRSRVRLRLVRR